MKRPQHLIHGHLHNLIHNPVHKLLRTLVLVITLTLGTPTAWAVDWDEVEAIAKQTTPATLQKLIDAAAQYNAEENNQYTALHWAVGFSDLDVIKALIAVGADVDAQDKYGDTPLHWAVGYGYRNLDVVTALIAGGADVDAQSVDGKTPLDKAYSEEEKQLLTNGISAADRARIVAEIAQIRTELKGGGGETTRRTTTAQTQNTGQDTGDDTGDGIGIMEMTITDACAEGRGIQYRLFGYANAQPQGEYIGLAPSGDKVFTLPEGGTATVTRKCKVGETNKIVKSWCFGGIPKPDEGDRYWGVGTDGDKGCEDCCGICPSEGTAEFDYNFTCDRGVQRASTEPSYSSLAAAAGWTYGYALGHASEREADKVAIERCQQYGGSDDCTVYGRFRGQGCAAIAKSNHNVAVGHEFGNARDLDWTEERAMALCGNITIVVCHEQGDSCPTEMAYESCHVTHSDCTDG